MPDTQTLDRHCHNPLVRYFGVLGGAHHRRVGRRSERYRDLRLAGAALGFGMLWFAPVTLPRTVAMQLICARIGLAGAIRGRYPHPFLYTACLLMLVANVSDIAADRAGMLAALAFATAW
jgi:hypothetical protein